MEAKILQTVLTAALMFAAYDKIANFIFKLLLNRQKSFIKAEVVLNYFHAY
ncbi:hypothetical protein Cfor_00943 [Coptotermes formosanus]|jgi:hypothetical protein|uniref:Uncharacterized protein n=1 Tax=Coptotermes formosanus TaxID=36987 RepID=A0A6L2PKS3_COPFO|nr:hypothetical protein Cfor_00943 [Coptotermes formosanus]